MSTRERQKWSVLKISYGLEDIKTERVYWYKHMLLKREVYQVRTVLTLCHEVKRLGMNGQIRRAFIYFSLGVSVISGDSNHIIAEQVYKVCGCKIIIDEISNPYGSSKC